MAFSGMFFSISVSMAHNSAYERTMNGKLCCPSSGSSTLLLGNKPDEKAFLIQAYTTRSELDDNFDS